MGQAHAGLEEAALRLGIRPRMGGPYRKKDFRLFLAGEERNVA
jgi:hypothetical protein